MTYCCAQKTAILTPIQHTVPLTKPVFKAKFINYTKNAFTFGLLMKI